MYLSMISHHVAFFLADSIVRIPSVIVMIIQLKKPMNHEIPPIAPAVEVSAKPGSPDGINMPNKKNAPLNAVSHPTI